MRRSTSAALLLSLALIGYLAWTKAPKATPSGSGPSRPEIKHVILLTIDALRADALPFHGSTRIATPNLTALCQQGVCFSNAQSPSPWTRPSVTSILTGLHPSIHATVARAIEVESVLPPSTRTLAECMRAARYRTAGIGYNPFLAVSPNIRRGFQDFWFYPTLISKSDGSVARCKTNTSRPALPGIGPGDLENGTGENNSTPILTQLAEQWLRRHGKERFFLWVHYYDPHNPYTPPRECATTLPAGAAPNNDEAYAAWVQRINFSIDQYLHAERYWLQGAQTAESEEVRRTALPVLLKNKETIRALYEAEINYVDAAVGRILDTVKGLGIYEDTLIIVSSDHGEEFGEHGRFEHGHSLYQELLHVPLIVKLPGRTRPHRVDHRVSIEGIYSTILELCSIAPAGSPGSAPSLVPHWEQPDPPTANPGLVAGSIMYGEPGKAVLLGDKKYIHREKKGADEATEELYDLRADPAEQHSLVTGQPEVVEKARRALKAHATWSRALKKEIWSGRAPTTVPNEKTRKVLRSHRYIK